MSRYAKTPEHRITHGGREVAYLGLRLLPEPPAAGEHRVTQGERPDLLAFRYFSDAHQAWRICDANRVLLPSDLTSEPNRVVKIPLPER